MTALQKVKAELKQLKSDHKGLGSQYKTALAVLATTDSELRAVTRQVDISNNRTNRKEKVLKDIRDITSGMYNAYGTDNKVVMLELINSVSRMAMSEITLLKEVPETNGCNDLSSHVHTGPSK